MKNRMLYETTVKIMQALSGDNYPKDGVCSHFGIFIQVGRTCIQYMGRGKKLLVIIGSPHDDFSHRTNLSRIRAVRLGLGNPKILEHWNDYTSVVFDYNIPTSLLIALSNYRTYFSSLSNSEIEPQYNIFKDWWKKRLEIINNIRYDLAKEASKTIKVTFEEDAVTGIMKIKKLEEVK